jgi:hypothetical protein
MHQNPATNELNISYRNRQKRGMIFIMADRRLTYIDPNITKGLQPEL